MSNRTASYEATKEADVSLAGLGEIIGTVEHEGALLVLCTLGVLRRDGDRLIPLKIGEVPAPATSTPVGHPLWDVSVKDALRFGRWPSARMVNCLKNEEEEGLLSTLGDVFDRATSDWLRTPNFGRRSMIQLQSMLEDWLGREDEVLAALVRSGLRLTDSDAAQTECKVP